MATITEILKGEAVQPSLKQNEIVITSDHDVEVFMYVKDREAVKDSREITSGDWLKPNKGEIVPSCDRLL